MENNDSTEVIDVISSDQVEELCRDVDRLFLSLLFAGVYFE